MAPAGVSNIKQIGMLTPGPVRLGTRWRKTREVMGALDSAEMEITSFERNRTYTITHHKAGVLSGGHFLVRGRPSTGPR